MSQRFFCVNRRRTSEISEEFHVLGSTGNVRRVSCTPFSPELTLFTGLQGHRQPHPQLLVPRRYQGEQCKHVLFILLKGASLPPSSPPRLTPFAVLQVPLSSNLYYQTALLTSELVPIFAQAPRAPLDAATERLRALYKVVTGQEEAGPSAGGIVAKRLPEEGDSYPACCELRAYGKAERVS